MAKRAKRPAARPVYFTVRSMMDADTGEIAGCLVPADWANNRILRERKYRNGDVVRATLANPRNAKFHRLVHQLGVLVQQNIEGFESLDSHAVIKRLQRESGIFCEVQRTDAAPMVGEILAAAETLLGEMAARMLTTVLPEIKEIDVITPQSIAFDSMDEGEFRSLWAGICWHLIRNYWPSLTPAEITKMVELMPQFEE